MYKNNLSKMKGKELNDYIKLTKPKRTIEVFESNKVKIKFEKPKVSAQDLIDM